MWLLRTLLQALQQRNALDTALVDDVVLGCVTPVGEQGADIARTAVLDADWAQTVRRRHAEPLLRLGPRESVNLAAAKVTSGLEDLVVAGGVESMSRWPMGSDGGAWVMDPRINQKLGFVPQGIGADLIATLEGWEPRRCRRLRAALAPEGRARRAPKGASRSSVVPVRDIAGLPMLAATRPSAPRDARGDGQARAQLRDDGPDGLRRHRAAQVHDGRAHRRTCTTPATRRASSTARR